MLTVGDASDPYDAFERGHALHSVGGQGVAAETAYREAIAGGVTDAWLNLGILLATQRGREREEAAALRAAMASANLTVATWAAVRLGALLAHEQRDASGARACFEFAEEHGTGSISFAATGELAVLLAFGGDIDAARDRFRSFAIWYGHERHQDMSGTGAEIPAVLHTWLAGGRFTRRPWWLVRRGIFRARRRWCSLLARSRRATTQAERFRAFRARFAERFWT